VHPESVSEIRESSVSIVSRNNIHVRGTGDRAMLFAQGFGCNQGMWRFVAPHFESEFLTVLIDHAGAGAANAELYLPERHRDLQGYADDMVEIGQELRLKNAVFVGHSCSAMIGALASLKAPTMFDRMVLIGASPCYANKGAYFGGFGADAIKHTLAAIRSRYHEWTATMAPVFMRNASQPALAEELRRSFHEIDPRIAAEFADVIFHSDLRADLAQISVESLILQCADDPVVPANVAKYLHLHIPGSQLEVLNTEGHFPQLSAPEQVTAAIRRFACVRSDAKRARKHPANHVTKSPSRNLPLRLNRRSRAHLEELLLLRAGELLRHLGRYDMYARATAAFVTVDRGNTTAAAALNIRTRGTDTARKMSEHGMAEKLVAEFIAVDRDLLSLLARHEIAAHNDAVIVGAGENRAGFPVHTVDWYDFENSTDDELLKFVDSMERDIVEITTLYIRLTKCAMEIRRMARLH
jgi:sigma-B regulation protein RsbQ